MQWFSPVILLITADVSAELWSVTLRGDPAVPNCGESVFGGRYSTDGTNPVFRCLFIHQEDRKLNAETGA